MPRILLAALALTVVLLIGCGGPGHWTHPTQDAPAMHATANQCWQAAYEAVPWHAVPVTVRQQAYYRTCMQSHGWTSAR